MAISLFDVVLHEPDVALTDLALSVETLVFALLFVRMRPADSALRVRAALLFAALSASSLLGALYHGFFPLRTATPGGWLVWILTMTAIGGAATVFWMLIGSLGRKPPSWLTPVALAAFAAYVLFVVAGGFRVWGSIAVTAP